MGRYDSLKLGNQLCFPLYASAREIVNLYHPHLRELDLTYTQYIAMMVLWERGEISAREVGKLLFLDSGTLTPVLKSLEKKGYITRSRSKEDERVLLVAPTDAGMALRERALEIPEKIGCAVRLTEEEAGTLYTLLYKILAALPEDE